VWAGYHVYLELQANRQPGQQGPHLAVDTYHGKQHKEKQHKLFFSSIPDPGRLKPSQKA
jgi:hypothetical protein